MDKLLLLSCCVVASHCSNILVVFPVPERSHRVLGESIVKILLEAGHEVTWVTPFPRDIKWSKLDYIDISSTLIHETETGNNDDHGPSISELRLNIQQLGSRYAGLALRHPALQELMMNTTVRFDAVVAEWYHSGLLAPLASVFDCPLVWYTPEDISWQTYGLVHGDSSLDFMASTLQSPSYSLPERLRYLWSKLSFGVRNYFHISATELPEYEACYLRAFQSRRRVLPNYEELVYQGSALLINSHPPLGHKIPLPLNAKFVGGHHIVRKVSPMPKNIAKLLEASKAGVIYVNLESHVTSGEVSHTVIQELIEIFGVVQQTVIWKSEEIQWSLPQNVFMMKNPPQNIILTYINHGQMLSIVDAIHFGVPVIGVPLLEDHIVNMDSVVKRGCGIKVDYTNEFAWKVKDAVNRILKMSSYREQSNKDKLIFRNRVATPQSEVLHLMQLVLDSDGAGHLQSSTLFLSVMERHNLDIIILVLMFFWFLNRAWRLFGAYFVWGEDDSDDKKYQ
ncbi:UDP-glucosyltransferase 2-like isoform X2 [Danaus plexippus]|uniref:UDP-glucosyltransferase 2-like isoform X2 n=1 Tax=Danaus plexippus TaxID=13037 RepID=UPI002AB1D287|nr:UDP-glucosyltransferase 2-like isoform X2 [Danaus plexippus]